MLSIHSASTRSGTPICAPPHLSDIRFPHAPMLPFSSHVVDYGSCSPLLSRSIVRRIIFLRLSSQGVLWLTGLKAPTNQPTNQPQGVLVRSPMDRPQGFTPPSQQRYSSKRSFVKNCAIFAHTCTCCCNRSFRDLHPLSNSQCRTGSARCARRFL